MADALTSTLKASLGWSFVETLDLSSPTDAGDLAYSKNLADGTGASQADKVWHDSRSILTTANDDLDLTALTHTIFGSTVTINFARITAILIVNLSTTAGEELLVKADVAAAFLGWCNSVATSVAFIGPNSPWLVSNVVDGWAVTNTTADILRINNPNATTVSYKIAIIGRSA